MSNAFPVPMPADPLPGRAEPLPVPERHFVNGARIVPPFPPGLELAEFALGCFWGAERRFWQQKGVHSTAVGYAAGLTPNPTYREVCSGRTGHTEAVLVVFDPAQTSYPELLRVFWESHDPTQGMRQGNDVGTQYRSGIYAHDRHAAAPGAGLARGLPAGAGRGRLRSDHHRDPRGRPVLLRRGIPPAVPGEESRRLLRSRRHRSGVLWVRIHADEPGVRMNPDPQGFRNRAGSLGAGLGLPRGVRPV